MTNEQIIKQLSALIDDREAFCISDPEHDESYIKDIDALKAAIEFLKNAAPVKHGAWAEKKGDTTNWIICCDGYYPFCSGCGEEPPGREMSKYCPNCGRRMVTPERRKA